MSLSSGVLTGLAIGSYAFYLRYYADRHWKFWMAFSVIGLVNLVIFWVRAAM